MERGELHQSILDLSGDLTAARRALALQRPKESLEDIQRQAREKWFARRPADPEARLSSEERQQKAAERWLEYRHAQQDHPGQEKDWGQEKDSERTKDLGHDIDDDFGL